MDALGEVNINIFNGSDGTEWKLHHHVGIKSHPTLLESVTNPQFSGTKDHMSMDFTIRHMTENKVIMVSLVSVDNNIATLRGFLHTPELDYDTKFEIKIDINDQDEIKLGQVGPDELALLDKNGNPSGYRFSSYSVTSGIDGNYLIHSGIVSNPKGEKAEFVLSMDPGPAVALPAAAVVTIFVVKTIALLCIVANVIIGTVALATIAACYARGCVPTTDITSTPSLSWNGLLPEISCTFTIKITCACPPAVTVAGGVNGAVIDEGTEETESEDQ